MNRKEFDSILKELNLNQTDFSKIIKVHPRTVRRWAQNPEELPESINQLFIAWKKLNDLDVIWNSNKIDEIKKQSILKKNGFKFYYIILNRYKHGSIAQINFKKKKVFCTHEIQKHDSDWLIKKINEKNINNEWSFYFGEIFSKSEKNEILSRINNE